MRKIKRIVAAVLCASVLFTGCSKTEIRNVIDNFVSGDLDTELTKQIFSKNFQYQIDAPESWENLNSVYPVGNLGKDSDVMYLGSKKGVAVMEVTIGSSAYVGYDAFMAKYIQILNSSYSLGVKMDDFQDKEFNGYKTKYIEIEDVFEPGDEDAGKFRIWSYCLDNDKGIAIFQVLVPQENATDEVQRLIESMISTFRKY